MSLIHGCIRPILFTGCSNSMLWWLALCIAIFFLFFSYFRLSFFHYLYFFCFGTYCNFVWGMCCMYLIHGCIRPIFFTGRRVALFRLDSVMACFVHRRYFFFFFFSYICIYLFFIACIFFLLVNIFISCGVCGGCCLFTVPFAKFSVLDVVFLCFNSMSWWLAL